MSIGVSSGLKGLVITLAELTEGLKGAELRGDGLLDIQQIEYDSRLIKPDSLFVAVKGFKQDGHDFLEQAFKNGAVAAMGEREHGRPIGTYVRVPKARKAMADIAARFYGYPGRGLPACGVTGTNGKTTTCYMLKSVLEAGNKRVGLVTSQRYDTGKEQFKAERTTPESLDMQRLLFLMIKNNCTDVVVEVSSHALTMHRTDNIDFRVAVYTNLTRDHLDFHRTMDDYYQAKALLAKRLRGPSCYAVINLDVPQFKPLFDEVKASCISYSLSDRRADVYCGDCELTPEGTTFDLVTRSGICTITLKLPGRFNLLNALAASAGGLASGLSVNSVAAGLERVAPVPGRFDPVKEGQPFAVYVDYAHTPDAIERLCEATREFCHGRLLLLFGCGGDRDKGKRPLMGKAATGNADYVVVTSDNPRGEAPEEIINDIKPGLQGNSYEIQVDRRDAIDAVLRKAQPGDAVLLAGKGTETYQEIKGERIPFNDIAEAKAVLATLGYKHQTDGGEN